MVQMLRLRRTACYIVATLAAVLAGCSMHPLPEDVSQAGTFDIVERIRCEIREGLSSFSLDDKAANRIIENTKIGYDLDFQITERNAATTGRLEFRRPAFRDASTGFFLNLSGGASKIRDNRRIFRILEDLAEPRQALDEACSKTAKDANLAYPITGATGMAEVVRTYIKLEKLTDLAITGVETTPKGEKVGNVFSDELLFTTKLGAGATPKLELRTIAGEFRLSHTSLMGTASRDDIHRLTVALSRAEGVDVDLEALAARLRRSDAIEPLAASRARADDRDQEQQ